MQQAVAIAQAAPLRWAERLGEWAEAERGRFAPWLAVFMAAGGAAEFTLTAEPPRLLGAGLAAAGAGLAVLLWRLGAGRMAALAVLAFGLGVLSAQWATWRAAPMPELPRKAAVLTATVQGVDTLPDGRRLLLADVRIGDGDALSRRIRVRLKRGDDQPIVAGDVVRLRVLVRPPEPPSFPGGWDQQFRAYFDQLAGGGTALDPASVTEHHAPSGFGASVQSVRDAIGRRVMAAVPGPTGAIAATFLTGSTYAISPPDRAAFRDSGLAHLLAVAGLHIGIVMALVFVATRRLLVCSERLALFWPVKQLAAVTALAAGMGYMFLAGAHVPVMRSFAMACLVTLGLVAGRRAISLRGWMLAAMALLAIAPQEVVGVSFQMSFAAVLALITGYEALRPALARLDGEGWWRRTLSRITPLLLTSALAGTASAPYGAYHFGHIQLYFVAANVIAVPLTAMWVMPCGLIGLLLMPFGLERLALAPMGWGVDVVLAIGRTVSAWPSATLPIPPTPGWGLVTFSLGLCWLCLWRTRWRLLGVLPILAGLISPYVTPVPDMLVSADARLIALRSGDAWWMQTNGSSAYTLAEWQSHFGTLPFRTIVSGMPPICDAQACRLGPVLLLRAPGPATDCDGVALVVSADPAGRACPRSVRLVDRFTVWREGSQAIWIVDGQVRVVSDRQLRGDRPWVAPVPTRRSAQSTLPAAPAETLPNDP